VISCDSRALSSGAFVCSSRRRVTMSTSSFDFLFETIDRFEIGGMRDCLLSHRADGSTSF
jgi:hypothetical protein